MSPHLFKGRVFATSELQEASSQDNVWYEFQPGDVVPVFFGFIGVVEGGTKQPAVLRANKQIFFVISKNHPIRLSFARKTYARDNANQAVLAIVPRRKGKGGQLAWMMYIGEEGDPESAMDSLVANAE